MSKSTTNQNEHLERATQLGLWGLVDNWSTYRSRTWVAEYLRHEQSARAERSLARRAKQAQLGMFKPMAEFDWAWPKTIKQQQIKELFELKFIEDKENVLLLGNSGTGKTMIAKNLGSQAVAQGYRVLFTTAMRMLNDLADQNPSALQRKLRKYTKPDLLIIDELGYLASTAEHANLMFEVITTRYEQCPIVITSNKAVGQWGEVFPEAACLNAMADRLLHRAVVIEINADSYRRKEATENAKRRRTPRRKKATSAAKRKKK